VPSTDDSTPPRQRVHIVDALRGLALVGMLLVHFQYYVHDDSIWSLRVNEGINLIAVNRFYPLFAVLFGVGFTLQFTRWGERPGFVKMYLRRLAGLIIIAILLGALTGYRVLESYAFWALPLLAVRRWSNRDLVILLLICAFSRPAAEFAVWRWERMHVPVEQSNANVRAESRASPNYHREADRLRDEGNFAQLALHRLRHNVGRFLDWRFYIPSDPFPLFILGMIAVRSRIFDEPLKHRRLLIALITYGLIALIGTVLAIKVLPDGSDLRLTRSFRYLMFAIFDERFQGLAYAGIIILATARAITLPAMIRILAAPGRLSLTNYVMQVAILETLFASSTPIISLNRWTALLGVIVVFAAQILFSRWWISRFRFGPLEWLWRSFTFARMEPLRRDAAARSARA